MPQFTYSATDTTGNVVEGTVAANDMMVAADQVRRMGYTPVRVEVSGGQPAVASRPLSAGAVAALDGSGVLSPQYAELAPPEVAARPMPLDLSQVYAETGANGASLDTLLAPTLEAGALTAPTLERRLEPWERSVGVGQETGAQELAAPQNAVTAGQTITTTGANAATDTALNPLQTAQAQSHADIRIPYGAGAETHKDYTQQFLEKIVYPLFSGVVLKELAPFLRQFATLINAGLPLYQALVALESNTKNAKLKEIARAGQRQVQAGGRFSEVMAAYPWIFQPMQVAMVRAAEQGGMLDDVLRQIADYVDHDIEIRRLISRETLYPKITLFMALMILGRPGFAQGMPAVSKLVLGGMGNAAGQGYGFINYLADTLGFGLALGIPFVAIVIAFRLFLFNIPGVRESYDSFKFAIPTIGKITQMFATAKFARTYAALYRGGFAAGSALSIAGDASGNGVIRRAALNAIPDAERGGLVSDALARSRAFPSMAIDMFRTGETSGALDQMLDRMADYYEAEGKQKSHQGAMILGVVVFLVVAFLVASSIITQYTGMAVRSTTLPPEAGE